MNAAPIASEQVEPEVSPRSVGEAGGYTEDRAGDEEDDRHDATPCSPREPSARRAGLANVPMRTPDIFGTLSRHNLAFCEPRR
jgi:hypothetical protein